MQSDLCSTITDKNILVVLMTVFVNLYEFFSIMLDLGKNEKHDIQN